jgi:hypothetical protein
MLQVARLAPKLLGESAENVHAFVRSQLTDRAFANRDGQPDLYYTVFGLDCLHALRAELPVERVTPYLESFGDGSTLDVVHLACLARAWAAVGAVPSSVHDAVVTRLSGVRQSVYESFLAVGALQDVRAPIDDAQGLASFLEREPPSMTPNVAAAVALWRQIGRPVPLAATEWLMARVSPGGGFVAGPQTPVPDLLSTAVALHALAGAEVPLDPVREPCLDFLDSLWTSRGSFYGHWGEADIDVEYTFYGLLALGHLCV